jgi:hypothetical protein
MRTLPALLLLVLTAALALADPPPVPGRVVFSTLTLAEAQKLDGRRGRFVITLDSAPADRGGFVVYDCAGHDDTLRTVWLVAGQEADREMTVDAVLRLRYVPARGAFTGFWEYRLTDAGRVRFLPADHADHTLSANRWEQWDTFVSR